MEAPEEACTWLPAAAGTGRVSRACWCRGEHIGPWPPAAPMLLPKDQRSFRG